MKQIKIYDTSNSKKRPLNRGFGGSIENENIFDIKNFLSGLDNFLIIDKVEEADIVLTNDVFFKEEVYLLTSYVSK
jgi:hypothetical protein